MHRIYEKSVGRFVSGRGINPIVRKPVPGLVIDIYEILVIEMYLWKITFIHIYS